MTAPLDDEPKGANGTLIGTSPPTFNGDRDKSDVFLDKFLGYELINADKKVFQTPYLKVVLCLSYITGPKVDAWVKLKREWLKSQVKHQRHSFNDKRIWEDFKEDFRTAFMDTDAKLMAFEKLHNLRMVGSDIDSYIAEFEWLREETGYRKDVKNR
jgi:Retrotransposon gag protein